MGIEPTTSAVLKPRHNQLDHPCLVLSEGYKYTKLNHIHRYRCSLILLSIIIIYTGVSVWCFTHGNNHHYYMPPY